MLGLTIVWLPTIGSVILIIVGVVAAVGYARTQAGKTWRESAEGWKTENEANKERADRLATELAHTAAELKSANLRTDITAVLGVLQEQHKEATAILTRIADESAERNGQIAKTLAVHGAHETLAWKDIMEIAANTLKTVEELRKA